MKRSWFNLLQKIKAFDFIKRMEKDYDFGNIYPDKELIFHCFDFFELEETKLVILGQDPYHGIHQAMGLSFSVPSELKSPPSLKNIFKEIKEDIGISRTNNNLTDWAKQNILLLNSILTVEKNSPNSHSKIGWEKITNKIIEELDKKNKNIIYLFLGKSASRKVSLIKNSKYIICVPHPSPLSSYRGFHGSKIFSRINKILLEQKKEIIYW